MPASPPTMGMSHSGSGSSPRPAMFIAWMVMNEPRPVYTAWPNESMPPCPNRMLYDRQMMMR